jgi:hypothetical protein
LLYSHPLCDYEITVIVFERKTYFHIPPQPRRQFYTVCCLYLKLIIILEFGDCLSFIHLCNLGKSLVTTNRYSETYLFSSLFSKSYCWLSKYKYHFFPYTAFQIWFLKLNLVEIHIQVQMVLEKISSGFEYIY